jgi:hypothetical protein
MAELPLPPPFARRRRRLATADRVIQYAMRAVLLSPLLVVLVWSGSMALWWTTKSSPSSSSSSPTNSNGMAESTRRGAVRIPVRPKHNAILQQLGNTGKEGLLEVVQVMEHAFGNSANSNSNAMMMVMEPPSPPGQPQQQQPLGTATAMQQQWEGTIVRPRPGPHPRDTMIVQPSNSTPVPQEGETLETPLLQQQGNEEFWPLEATAYNGGGGMMAVQPQPPVLLGNSRARPHMRGTSQYASPQVMMMARGGRHRGNSQNSNNNNGIIVAPLSSTNTQQQQQQEQVEVPPPPLQQQATAPVKTTVYYYDPKATARDEFGRWYLPDTVYDKDGRPMALNNLQQRAREIYLEPPPLLQMVHHNATNATIINITYSHPNVVSGKIEHKRTSSTWATSAATNSLKNSANQSWGQSTVMATDQSIIVATVGVMALLVGAFSARRMRSRSILSSCIENESLEDDVAYDTAYTVQHSDSNSYHTFSALGWKDDLEKFDV